MRRVNANLLVSYADRLDELSQIDPSQIFDGAIKPRLFFEYHSELINQQITLRLYPAVSAQIGASFGTVDDLGINGLRRVTGEIVEFSGSERAITEYPISGNFQTFRLKSATSTSVLFDAEGNPISPSFQYDPEAGEIVASRPCYGLIRVNYDSLYRLVNYAPEINRLPNGGVQIQLGTVYAFYQGATTTFKPQFRFSQEERDWTELYRVTSTTIKDRNGEWEKPPGWPDDNTYPGLNLSGDDLPDPDAAVDQARVHEWARITTVGRQRRERFYTPNLRPYIGYVTFKPVWTYQRAAFREGFEAAMLSVDWAEIEASVAARYPGVQGLS